MNFLPPDILSDAFAPCDLAPLVRGATGAFVAFTLVAARIGGMVLLGPVFGHPHIPVRIRLFLVLAMSMVITPVLLGSDQRRTFNLLDRDHDHVLMRDEVPVSLVPQFEDLIRRSGKRSDEGLAAGEFHLSLPLPDAVIEYASLALVEFGLGVALGLGVMTIVSGLQMAGNLVDAQIGLSLGSVFNPEFETETSPSGELLHRLGLVVFLVAGGHHLIVSALLDTFQSLPVGFAWVSPPAIELLVGLVHQSLVLAVQIAAPVMGLMAVVGVAMGILGRTIPQLNVLVVGLPVRTLVGLLIVGLAVPEIAEILASVLPDGIRQLRDVLMGHG
ncbi:MAG: flagellar biosynthetic protein FliR [Deltaproteobacteria bacterium]